MKKYVVDASALLVFLEDSTGAMTMQRQLERAADKHQPILMSVLSWGELYQVVAERHAVDVGQVIRTIDHLPIQLVDVDRDTARLAAQLSRVHRLPYLCCFSIALAEIRNATLLTSDKVLAEKFGGVWLCAASPG